MWKTTASFVLAGFMCNFRWGSAVEVRPAVFALYVCDSGFWLCSNRNPTPGSPSTRSAWRSSRSSDAGSSTRVTPTTVPSILTTIAWTCSAKISGWLLSRCQAQPFTEVWIEVRILDLGVCNAVHLLVVALELQDGSDFLLVLGVMNDISICPGYVDQVQD